jgi:hypothetical protein
MVDGSPSEREKKVSLTSNTLETEPGAVCPVLRLEALERDKRYRQGPDASTIDYWTIAVHPAVWAELE